MDVKSVGQNIKEIREKKENNTEKTGRIVRAWRKRHKQL